jgi:hypothetical protein
MPEHGAGSVSGGVHTLPKAAVDGALRSFERARTARKLKVSVRSYLIGALTQIPARPVRSFPWLPQRAFWVHVCVESLRATGPVQ